MVAVLSSQHTTATPASLLLENERLRQQIHDLRHQLQQQKQQHNNLHDITRPLIGTSTTVSSTDSVAVSSAWWDFWTRGPTTATTKTTLHGSGVSSVGGKRPLPPPLQLSRRSRTASDRRRPRGRRWSLGGAQVPLQPNHHLEQQHEHLSDGEDGDDDNGHHHPDVEADLPPPTWWDMHQSAPGMKRRGSHNRTMVTATTTTALEPTTTTHHHHGNDNMLQGFSHSSSKDEVYATTAGPPTSPDHMSTVTTATTTLSCSTTTSVEDEGVGVTETLHFWEAVQDRAGWLVGLLVLQSMSSFIIKQNEELLKERILIVQFLTMLVGAGGNAGNQASVRVIRGLALGTVHDDNAVAFFQKELKMGFVLAGILGVSGCVRAALFQTPLLETIAITASLWCIVFISIVLGCLLPMGMRYCKIDPAHSSTTIQVIMDILGVAITVNISSIILGKSNGWIQQMLDIHENYGST